MKLLADENIDVRIIRMLRDNGFDVASIGEDHPGVSDDEVLRLAAQDGRMIITSDLDFAHVLSLPVRDHEGICLLRLRHPDHHMKALHLLAALNQLKEMPLAGRIAVIQENQLRVYP